MVAMISKTDLARNTRDIVERVRSGQTLIVKSYGEEQIVLLDALDYRIMQSLVNYVAKSDTNDALDDVIVAYLDEEISVAKAAEQLGISRYELMERFERIGIPLRQGSQTIDDALDEIATARQANK